MDIFKKFNLHTIFNKSVSIMVCLVMILSVFSTCIVVNAANPDVWDGSKAQGFAEFKGNGTVDSPYEIENGAQLAYVVSTDLTDGLYYKLVKDIRLNDTSNANWKESARNWVWGDVRFVGNFDGDGHTIDGLYFKGSQKRFGLFSYIGDSVIANIRFTNAYVENTTSEEGQAIVAAQASAKADFDRIYIDASCEINAPNVKGVAGIIARSNQNVNITNSAVFGKYVGKSHVGAFFGTFWGGTQTIKNCFTACDVPVIASRTPTVENTYAIVKEPGEWYDRNVTFITADQMKGEAAKTNMPGLDFDNVWQVVENDYPMLLTMIREEEEEQIEIWGGKPADTTAIQYVAGDGTQANPFQIENGDQLYKMVAENTKYKEADVATVEVKYFKIIKDIYLNDVAAEDLANVVPETWAEKYNQWYYAPANQETGFSGVVDGGGHTVYGVYHNGLLSAASTAGLIPNVVGKAEITNLNVEKSYAYGKCAGALVGLVTGENTELKISKCTVDNTCVQGWGSSTRVGGMVGGSYVSSASKNVYITISDCALTNMKLVCKNATQAGILGYGYGNKAKNNLVKNCYTDETAFPGCYSTGTYYPPLFKDDIKYENVYTSATKIGDYDGITVLTADQMKGDAAKTNMLGFDFDTVWKTVADNYPTLITEVEEEIEIWDGETADSFAGDGDGSKEKPFLIENAAQLYKMVTENVNASSVAESEYKYYKITRDIYINNITEADLENPSEADFDAKGFKAWFVGANNKGFYGELDGGGHTVYGLYCKKGANNTTAGLIPTVIGGKVTNLKLENAYVRATYTAGGIVGLKYGSLYPIEVNYCSLKNAVVNCTGSVRAGGIVGGGHNQYVGTITISNCAVTRSEFTTGSSGYPRVESGILGYIGLAGNHTVSNCFIDDSAHPLSNSTVENHFNTNMGSYVTFTNVYYIRRTEDADRTFLATSNVEKQFTVLTADQMKGDAAKTNMPALDFDNIWETVANDYPVINVRGTSVTPPPAEEDDGFWDGTAAESFAGGLGTAESPFLIANASQLFKMVKEYTAVSNDSAFATPTYFKLQNDIHINDVKDEDMAAPTVDSWNAKGFKAWDPGYLYKESTGFCGVIDGAGYTVYGLYCKEGTYGGLLPNVADSVVVTNLNVKNSYVRIGGNGGPGVIIGVVNGKANNRTTATVSYCTVDNCYVASEGTGSWRCGAIVGGGNGEGKITVSDCAVTRVTMTVANTQTPGRSCAFIGNTNTYSGHEITNCYTDASTHPVTNSTTKDLYDVIHGNKVYTNVYTSAAKPDCDTYGDITYLTDSQMKGEAAKTNMSGLDFNYVWKTVDGAYPAIYLREKPAKPPRPDFVWDGTKATEFAGGKGTAAEPYLVSNGAQLYKMVMDFTVSSNDGEIKAPTYFKITNDIYLNDVKEADLVNPTTLAWDEAGHISWHSDVYSSRTVGFCGDVDGGGYTIYGLYHREGNYAGLIPIAADSTNVYNLNLKNSFIRANGNVTGGAAGGIIGLVSGAGNNRSTANVTYCKVDNTAIVADHTSIWRISAVVGGGYNEGKVVVSNCGVTNMQMTTINPDTVNRTGAFIGSTTYTNHEVTNCYSDSSVHPVSDTTDKTQYDTIHERHTYTNVYTSAAKPACDTYGDITYLTEAQMKGDNAKKNFAGFDFENDWAVVANDYPSIKENAGIWMYDTKLPGEAWSGKLARYFAGGNGSKDDPYQINTAGQLALLAQDALNGKTAGKYYVITADIIVNDTTKTNWKDTAHEWFTGYWDQAFYGNLNGGYHTISGLYLNKTRANYTGTHYYSGLFAAIGEGAVIEKLGIVNSSMTFTTSDAKIGAFAGFVRQYNAEKVGSENYPVIRECFADTSVYLEGTSAGGFIGTATRPIYIEDSFFTGKVAGKSYGIFGYSKMNKTYDEVFVKNCYVADAKYAIVSNVSYENFKYENVYSSSAQDTTGVIRLFIDKMTGAAAKENMTALDFENTWVVGEDLNTPGLKGFAKDAYNNYMQPFDIVVNFETNCDLIVEPMVGKAYSKLKLPVLQREGYVFAGWYAYPELDVPYSYDYYPTFDTILYAKWVLSGFAQDFEAYEDSIYDYHDDYEYYRPTSSNYTAKYVHGGAKSMHRLGNSNEDLDFLLMYADELVVGRKYTITFYTTTDQAKASVNTSLVHLDWPDVYSADNGVEKMASITNLTDGEWVETTYTFVARSKWIAIRTSGNSSVYFDDFLLYDVGQGTIVDISKPESDANNNENIEVEPDDNENDKPVEQKPDNKVDTDDTAEDSINVVLIVAIVAGSLLALGVIAFVIILIVKRKKK